ncbi:MAG: hypothetical protein LUH04_01205, partial [Clostridium sp.]|nr:hypothetical protein [Clostridium sp.]
SKLINKGIFLFFRESHQKEFERLLNDKNKYMKESKVRYLLEPEKNVAWEFATHYEFPTSPPCLILKPVNF